MIQVQGVGKEFQDRWIFRGLSLRVERGESVVLIGPSGSGKSVLLKTIAGLTNPSEGSITLESENLGMLFQKNALFDSFTVLENLLFPLKERLGIIGKPAEEKAKKFLTAVGLSGTENLYPDEISGGMQKRLGIARALIVEPEIILYDEPTAGLDPITSKTIAALIQKLRRESGSTLLTVTNDMQRAYQLGDRIYLLAQGKLLAGGTPEQVRATQEASLRQFIYGLKTGPLTAELV
jgi:phospholipid/cholesterol/gamma-HCH transport system ATP-binding protein